MHHLGHAAGSAGELWLLLVVIGVAYALIEAALSGGDE